jgi:hypothetical protein
MLLVLLVGMVSIFLGFYLEHKRTALG